MTDKPLAIFLFAGLFGWSAALVEEGWRVVGFDIEDMHANFGLPRRSEFQLVIQNVLTIHGSQFKDAALIVASPPCQKYSYMAMPWTKAKAMAAAIRADDTGEKLDELNRLFNACFRIQREACEAAGRHIPMVVENVKGAQPWVGRARYNFGSFYFWGHDVPALMPPTFKGSKVPGFRFDGSGRSFQTASVEHTGFKTSGMNWSDRTKTGQDFTRIAGHQAMERDEHIKLGGSWFHGYRQGQGPRNHGPKSKGRKMASAMIAKIPLEVSTWIARCFKPT